MKRIALAIAVGLAANAVNAGDLASVYQLAVQNDPNLAAAQATRDATLEQQPIARSLLLPNLSISGEANKSSQDFKGTVGSSDFGTQAAAIQLLQPLYRRDRLIRLDQAEDQVAQADFNLSAAEQDLIIRVATAYFTVLGAQDNLEFSVSEKKAIARQLDQAKQRFEVGLIAITGVHEAQARFDQARADELAAENLLDNAIEALVQITGEYVDTLAVLKREIPLNNPEPSSLEVWAETALANNPNLLSAQYDTEIAKKQIDFQSSGHWPSLDLVGSYGVARSDSGFSPGTNDSDTGTIGLQLNIPLYSGGGVNAATRQAVAQHEASKDVLEERRRSVRAQVRNAYRGVQSSISRVNALEATQVSANSALEATEAGFEVGTRTLVDVLNSQSDLFAAKRDLARSRYDYILNTLRLFQASGSLDESDIALVNTWLGEEKSIKP
ncbi:MAG: TolC family outer membrane protein [Sedimenticolaceae bacterium]